MPTDKPAPIDPAAVTLRPHQVGDIGWVAHRQGLLYAQEYGWDQTFEALVAEIAAGFVRNFQPQFERCWIAEHQGQVLGSVFLVKVSEGVNEFNALCVDL